MAQSGEGIPIVIVPIVAFYAAYAALYDPFASPPL